MRRPSLNSLLFFDTAARLGSFVQAALELHVTHGAVSRQIRHLEDELGVVLFERRNRAIFLTAQGHTLLTSTRRIFDEIDGVVTELQRSAEPEPVVVSCEPTITMKWLIPNLPKFNAAYPSVPMHIFAAGGAVDFKRQKIDVALRRNDFYWDPSVHAVEVARELIGPVCAPEFAEQVRGGMRDVSLLHTERRLSAWDDWARVTGNKLNSKSGQTYEYFHLSIQAAISGLGVAISSIYMVQDELMTGRLVAPLGFVEDGSAYYLLSAKNPQSNEPILAFENWVRRTLVDTRSANPS